MRGAGTATDRAAGADQSVVHDLADGAGAAATLSTAAEAAIDLTRGARRARVHGDPHIMVGQHVAGADDHRNPWRDGLSLPGEHRRVKGIRSLELL